MRWLPFVLIGLTCLGCASDPEPSRLGCVPPASTYGANCACFDGDVRCDPYPMCPVDLTAACTPAEMCGDLSGGSAGQDCECTCSASGAWSCAGEDGTCIPM